MQNRKKVDRLQNIQLLKHGLGIFLYLPNSKQFKTTSKALVIAICQIFRTGSLEKCISGFSRDLLCKGPYGYLLFVGLSAKVIVEKLELQIS